VFLDQQILDQQMSLPQPIPARNRLPNRRACETIAFELTAAHAKALELGLIDDGGDE
jgi:hypothetical protein